MRVNLRCLALLLLFATLSMARGTTYVVFWFDTEDYIDPIADDAALRIANDLTSLGVHGTFTVVGEKARVLERRGRTDVIQALGRHCIGYHSDWHSVQPVSAPVLQHLGLLEGANEFWPSAAWGVHVYFDQGTQVGYGDQPIWFGGMLYVFNLGHTRYAPISTDTNRNRTPLGASTRPRNTSPKPAAD